MLDINFIIPLVLIFFVLLIYIVIKRIPVFKSESNDEFDLFLKNLKTHMNEHHPKIKIDYSVAEKIKKDKNLDAKENIIIESVIAQFFNFSFERNTQKGIPKEKYWLNYYEKSASNPKFPSDWTQRKEAALKRENYSCSRCGERLTYEEAITLFVKDIKKGGGYNLENIIILCSDCNKILNTTNPINTMYSLHLNDKLEVLNLK